MLRLVCRFLLCYLFVLVFGFLFIFILIFSKIVSLLSLFFAQVREYAFVNLILSYKIPFAFVRFPNSSLIFIFQTIQNQSLSYNLTIQHLASTFLTIFSA